jgi:hypothetical protein
MGVSSYCMGYLQIKKKKGPLPGTQIWCLELAAEMSWEFLGEARIKNQITKRTILKSDTRPK